MPETDLYGAGRYLARVRVAVRRIQQNEVSGLRLSLGAATAKEGESLVSVMARADAAMYAAKKRRVHRPAGSSEG
jgi:GGDEF domain-containing protein